MCQNCLANTGRMLAITLASAPAALDQANYELAVKRGKPYTDDEQELLANTISGVALVGQIAEIYTDRDLTPEQTTNAIVGLLVSDPEERAGVKPLIAAAKFTHYAAVLLRDLAGNLDRAIQARASEEYHHDAIDFVFGDVHDEIEAHRIADTARERGEKIEEILNNAVSVDPRRIAALAARMRDSAGDFGAGSPKSGGSAGPNYKH